VVTLCEVSSFCAKLVNPSFSRGTFHYAIFSGLRPKSRTPPLHKLGVASRRRTSVDSPTFGQQEFRASLLVYKFRMWYAKLPDTKRAKLDKSATSSEGALRMCSLMVNVIN
jgi:hypothetical protein